MRTSRVDVVHEAAEAEQVEIRLLADDIRDHLHGAHHHPQSQDLDGYELFSLRTRVQGSYRNARTANSSQ